MAFREEVAFITRRKGDERHQCQADRKFFVVEKPGFEAHGDVTHAGGISLTAGGTVVRLEAFDIRLGAAPQLFASVDGSTDKIAIADLDLRAATPAVDGRRVTVGNVAVRLSQGAADALNSAFGITAIAAGLPLGVATVQASAR